MKSARVPGASRDRSHLSLVVSRAEPLEAEPPKELTLDDYATELLRKLFARVADEEPFLETERRELTHLLTWLFEQNALTRHEHFPISVALAEHE